MGKHIENGRKSLQRDSNFELLRIILMLLIIAHHYVANSGLMDANGPIYAHGMSFPSLFLLIVGAWGKTCINCFVLLTGYFMCKSNITVRKYLKLLLEYMFYHIAIWILFALTGRETFALRSLVKQMIPVTDVGTSFTSAYLVFYLFIPFLNILISHMTEGQHIKIVGLLLFVYVFLGTVPVFSVNMNYVSWFSCIYLVAAYVRIYPKKLYGNKKIWGGGALLSTFALASISIIACTRFGLRRGVENGLATSFYFVHDSNKVFALLLSVSAFMFIRNIRIPYNRFINTVAQSVFGVLMIHAHGSTMRRWLWRDVLNNVGVFGSPFMYVHMLLSVIGVFAVCTLIDQLRIRILERPLFAFYDAHEKTWLETAGRVRKKICSLLRIE